MPSPKISVRLPDDMREELRLYAAKQQLDESVVVRMFVRDGLAKFNAVNERILQNTDHLSGQVEILQQLIGASVHLLTEQFVLSRPRKPDESEEDYAERLRALYRQEVFSAVTKGKAIIGAVETGQVKVKK